LVLAGEKDFFWDSGTRLVKFPGIQVAGNIPRKWEYMGI